MAVDSTHSNPSPPELLAVSFSFPPLAYPRSVQVARLLKQIGLSTVVVCGDEPGTRRDPTIEPDAEGHLRACLRIPLAPTVWRRKADSVMARLQAPLWNKSPDEYVRWKPLALAAIKKFAEKERYKPDVLVTFGQPMSDHLIGLELKRQYGVPWLAHFSDPWVDNPFNRYDRLSRNLNLSLEREVMQTADRLAFTSKDTIDLVMRKYPEEWRNKTRVLPHCFDAKLYPQPSSEQSEGITIRYTGEFYGNRTPRPLIRTLHSILSTKPEVLARVSFELIGPVNSETFADLDLEGLPNGLVSIKPFVNYRESLRLAGTADGLIIIDAPAERSVFLPSKLIDYIGAARPVLALTPPGTAADIISELGGWVADPADVEGMKSATEGFLTYLSAKRNKNVPWGAPQVRKTFEAKVIAAFFEKMLMEMLA